MKFGYFAGTPFKPRIVITKSKITPDLLQMIKEHFSISSSNYKSY